MRSAGFYVNEKSTDTSGVPRNFVRGGGVQQIQLRTEDLEKANLWAVAPLVKGSGESCNLVQKNLCI